ncbi:MAG: aminoacyl-tRNA hydrolase [Treponema sp.]|jgi:PTH1 family peptidyl-tRNA hydrolase|nr:aminoacyl-tRNA hydrolase [Treponema sp.]
MIELIVFLGNPGAQYARNRHNAGRLLAESLPFSSSLYWGRKYKGLYTAFDGKHLLMPETFMNLSGESMGAAAAFFKIPPEQILVVHDELELPLGTASLKFSGGLGGHKGLRSIKACLNTADFWRLRIGIGRPAHSDIQFWVLSDFTAAETAILTQTLEACADVLLHIMKEEPTSLLPEWNKRNCCLEV